MKEVRIIISMRADEQNNIGGLTFSSVVEGREQPISAGCVIAGAAILIADIMRQIEDNPRNDSEEKRVTKMTQLIDTLRTSAREIVPRLREAADDMAFEEGEPE